MKRKMLIVLYIILVFITMKLVYNMVVNNILISEYKNSQYSEKTAKALTYINFPQTYVADYNYGNILYQKGEYEKAIEKYEKALKENVPQHKECNVRINYALAICQTVQLTDNDQESIKDAIEKYKNAIDILTENGCANKNDNQGHSQKAEQLKKDIQKQIDRLQELQKDDDENNQDEKQQKEKESKKQTKTIETKIQNIKEQATKEQRQMESEYKSYDKEFNQKSKNW